MPEKKNKIMIQQEFRKGSEVISAEIFEVDLNKSVIKRVQHTASSKVIIAPLPTIGKEIAVDGLKYVINYVSDDDGTIEAVLKRPPDRGQESFPFVE